MSQPIQKHVLLWIGEKPISFVWGRMHFSKVYSSGYPGYRNDKHIARTDAAIKNLLEQNNWLGGKSWEVICDSKGGRKVFHGSCLLYDGGYHRWPSCLVFPLKQDFLAVQREMGRDDSIRTEGYWGFGILMMRFNCLKQFRRLHCKVTLTTIPS